MHHIRTPVEYLSQLEPKEEIKPATLPDLPIKPRPKRLSKNSINREIPMKPIDKPKIMKAKHCINSEIMKPNDETKHCINSEIMKSIDKPKHCINSEIMKSIDKPKIPSLSLPKLKPKIPEVKLPQIVVINKPINKHPKQAQLVNSQKLVNHCIPLKPPQVYFKSQDKNIYDIKPKQIAQHTVESDPIPNPPIFEISNPLTLEQWNIIKDQYKAYESLIMQKLNAIGEITKEEQKYHDELVEKLCKNEENFCRIIEPEPQINLHALTDSEQELWFQWCNREINKEENGYSPFCHIFTIMYMQNRKRSKKDEAQSKKRIAALKQQYRTVSRIRTIDDIEDD